MTGDQLNAALRRFEEEAISTRGEARRWLRVWSDVRKLVLLWVPSREWDDLIAQDAQKLGLVQLVDTWGKSPEPLKARLISGLDLWLTRISLEWNLDGEGSTRDPRQG